ncbi:gamma-glutamyltranspeptidase / glutathione hydrolase [Amycolatopsis xylanica]|uniref:Glutathione hydrolase proenzyme n=1 Tax=Amycolatopsis xylanica TaxID=589385 RepID=A0A1H3JAE6_9PSEU|nr:gamma-glutamyltransferase [Amycolatopsis xylanica]SDY36549.1 gamma-glutamyltranspeptidase / glutathione hydrolase [Amycolatopsis xylanica]
MPANSFRLVGSAAAVLVLSAAFAVPASAAPPTPPKSPEAIGYFGAVSSIDADASAIGTQVLREGGNAVDAAVATAAALGVTDPFSAGIGGGGFLVFYDARTGQVHTLDGRETAPSTADANLFVENGTAIPFAEAVTSGLSVGVPGTPGTWQDALRKWGTRSLSKTLRPAIDLARRGFTVDKTFHDQVANNAARFAAFPSTKSLYLQGGQPPVEGTTFRNPDLADTYATVGSRGTDALYRGQIGADIVKTVQQPPVDPASTLKVRPGKLSAADLAKYRTIERDPTHARYRGLDVYGMPAPSSGGLTVAESLNILENFDLKNASKTDYYHYFLESTRLAFADRNRWIGDPAFVDVPSKELLSQSFANTRACLINPAKAGTSPVAPADPRNPTPCQAGTTGAPTPYEGENTTHLTVADKWGNVVAYTLTIEQEGGSGIVVPGRGFLLNNELTDFSFTPVTPGVPDPNLPGPGKRPRSSMAPTIVLDHGKPFFATGSPGGASIITTALEVLLGRIDRGLSLKDAIAAPRASQRNSAAAQVEQAFLDQTTEVAALVARGQGFSSTPAEIGAATGVEYLGHGKWLAAAEPVRRGAGAARVVFPVR